MSCKLDRAFINYDLLSRFTDISVSLVNARISDHSPIIVHLSLVVERSPKPFIFLNMWTRHPSFQKTVQEAWQTRVQGNPFLVVQKLRFVKAALKAWNFLVFGRVDERIRKAGEELDAIQSQLSLNQFNERLAEEEILKLDELNQALDTEEAFFKQKARVSWLKDGDHNTKYFHATLTEIRARNTIRRIKDESGTMLTGEADIKRQAELYFINLVGTASRVEGLFQPA